MSNKDDEGKLELSLRILGNEMDVIRFSCNWRHLMDYGTIWSYLDGDL
jgi:hypothetical protein